MSVLKEEYKTTVRKELKTKFQYENDMCIPQLKKVVISMGVAEALKDKNAMQDAVKELSMISGQKPVITKAKKSVSNFKLREGQGIGAKVTLRGKRMYDFLYRFTHIICPRVSDFRGFKKVCDGSGNFSLGLSDQQVFPELNLDDVKRVQGMNITFVTSASTDSECFELLKLLGMPFQKAS